MAKVQKWDREKGRQMWLEGKTDKEIASIWGVHPDAVGQVRRKIWELEPGAPKKANNRGPKTSHIVEVDPTPATEPQEVNCHEITTTNQPDFFDLVAHVVEGKTGMAAVVTGQAVLALKNNDLLEAKRCITWLIVHQ